MTKSCGSIRCYYPGSRTLGRGRGVSLEEPAAGNLHGGVCGGEISVGQGGPERARSRKRWKEAKGRLQPTKSPLLGENVEFVMKDGKVYKSAGAAACKQ
jgi:hypothetical protein